MIPFVTYREPDEESRLCFYILQKAFPHYVGLLVSSPRENRLVNAPIPGYKLWITYAGCLHGNFFPGHSTAIAEVNQVFNSMAEWYYVNRIKIHSKKYKSFKINETSISAG